MYKFQRSTLLKATLLLSLTGCGAAKPTASPEQSPPPVPSVAASTAEEMVPTYNDGESIKVTFIYATMLSTICGLLPDTVPKSLKDVQDRTRAFLEKGLPAEKFAKMDIKPLKFIGYNSSERNKENPPALEGRHYKMYLVLDNLQPLTPEAAQACQTGKAYKGWMAEEPYIMRDSEGLMLIHKNFPPYEIEVCDTNGNLSLEIIPPAPSRSNRESRTPPTRIIFKVNNKEYLGPLICKDENDFNK